MGVVDLSVVICTLNRSSLLKKCLESLAQQEVGRFTLETIVVDNGSTDDTQSVSESFARSLGSLRYVTEPRKGLARARDTGLKASTGRYVAYLDDDAIASPGWCIAICDTFRLLEGDGNIQIVALGGPCEPVFETGRPEWFTCQIGTYYGTWGLGDQPMIYPRPLHPIGANCAFPREVLVDNPWKAELVMLEDAELFRRLYQKGYSGLYIPRMQVRHFVPAKRLTLDWLLERRYTDGIALTQTFYRNEALVRRIRVAGSSLLKLIGLRALSLFGPPERRVLSRCKMMTHYGIVAGMVRSRNLADRPYLSEKWRPEKRKDTLGAGEAACSCQPANHADSTCCEGSGMGKE